MLQRGAVTAADAGSASSGAPPRRDLAGQGLSPQLGESFLDRLVELSTLNSDIAYRQGLTDRVIEESVTVATLEREQEYFEEMSRSLEEMPFPLEDVDQEAEILRIGTMFERALGRAERVVDQVNAIYEELSAKNLNPSTLLYTVTTPFTIRTERAVAARTVAVYGLLVFMLSILLVPLGCLVHSYFQHEIVRPVTREPTGRVPGGQSKEERKEEPAERTDGV